MTRPSRHRGQSHWTPDDIDRLERAIIEGARVQLSRRGTEYVVIPKELQSRGPAEVLIGTTNACDDLSFELAEVEYFEVIW